MIFKHFFKGSYCYNNKTINNKKKKKQINKEKNRYEEKRENAIKGHS